MEASEEFNETALPQGEFVLMMARSVGVLVAIVAVVLAVLLLMIARAFIAFMLTKVGVLGLSAFVFLLVFAITRIGEISSKSIWIILRQSCS
mgnify:CR=1 FL=1|jgi:hypothetical protein